MKSCLYKKILGVFLALALILCGGTSFTNAGKVQAERIVDLFYYVSLGDDIADGYGLETYENPKYNGFSEGSYTYNLMEYFLNETKGILAQSHAVSGQTSATLLASLDSFNVKTAIETADVVTINIGMNDIIEPAEANLADAILNFNVDSLDIYLSQAVSQFSQNLNAIVAKIQSYSPTAKIVLANIYNPYKKLINHNQNVEVVIKDTVFGYTISSSLIRQFGAKVEDYISGNAESGITGINQVIQNKVNQHNNLYLVDVKSAFDAYEGDYGDITNLTFTNYNTITIEIEVSVDLDVMAQRIKEKIEPYIDPYPTQEGHTILKNTHTAFFDNSFVYVSYDYNGGALNDYVYDIGIIDFNSKIAAPSGDPFLDNEHYFNGWYTDKAGEQEFDFDTRIMENITIYANYKIITFAVTFDYNGGSLNGEFYNEEIVDINKTVTQPDENGQPQKDKHAFVGWFLDLNSDEPYDFSAPITGSITLYAKWERNVFNVTFFFGEGRLNGASQTTIEVNKDKLIADIPTPELLDHEVTGWHLGSEDGAVWNFETNTVTEDISLYATWERNVLYVMLNYNGKIYNGQQEYGPIKLKEGEKLKSSDVVIPTTSGYLFIYWYLNNQGEPYDYDMPITQDTTLYAYWRESIKVNVHDGSNLYENDKSIEVVKGTTIAEFENHQKTQEIITSKPGRVVWGWFKEIGLTNEVLGNYVLEGGKTYYIKWVTLKCVDETLLEQSFSPIAQKVVWHIDAKDGSDLEWCVNGEIDFTATVDGNQGATYNYIPSAVGEFFITCKVDGKTVNGKMVDITYSTPNDIKIILNKVEGKRTYHLEVENHQYYDESKFVWYKTADDYTDEFAQEIGRGFECVFTFKSDCKVVAKYLEHEDSKDGITSNIIAISVDHFIDDPTLYGILGGVAVIAVITVAVIISRKKFKSYF